MKAEAILNIMIRGDIREVFQETGRIMPLFQIIEAYLPELGYTFGEITSAYLCAAAPYYEKDKI